MSSVNKAIIIGRLGQNPELKTLPNGTSVCNFSIATSKAWNDKTTGEKQEKTNWHNIVVWGKLAELCNQYLSKGRQVYVEGEIETRTYDDKDGKKCYVTEINARQCVFLSGNADKNEALKSADEKAPEYKVETDANFASDDIPF